MSVKGSRFRAKGVTVMGSGLKDLGFGFRAMGLRLKVKDLFSARLKRYSGELHLRICMYTWNQRRLTKARLKLSRQFF